jgi:IS1 family transposase/transposase-like protein
MIVTKHKCKRCQSENIVLNGKNKSGSQTYKCNDCGACRVLFSVKKTRNMDPDALARTYQGRNSLRSTARIFGVSHFTVSALLKKSQALSRFQDNGLARQRRPGRAGKPGRAGSGRGVLLRAANQIRTWIAQNRQNRQIVSFFIGDGTMDSCKRLRRKLPYQFLRCNRFSDFWKAHDCLPEATHQKAGKKTGETAHVERPDNTIRQRFSRFVRKTLSFSKKEYMLNLHFKLWAYHYNIAIINNRFYT